MSVQPPRDTPEGSRRAKPWKPWVLDRMLDSPARWKLEENPPAPTLRLSPRLLLVVMMILILGACAIIFFKGFSGLGNGSAAIEPTPTASPSLSPRPQETHVETPRAPVTPSAIILRPTATSTPPPTSTTRAVPPTATPFKYKVEAGDTLLGIAIRFGVSVADLKKANGLSGDVIRAGDELIIPTSR